MTRRNRRGSPTPKGHDLLRNVLELSHEVRICFADGRVIFGTVIPADPPSSLFFTIRPWGWRAPLAVAFADVARAATVPRMDWHKHRAIAMAQLAEEHEIGLHRAP